MSSFDDNRRALNRLKAGASYCGCGRYLKSLNEINRQEIYIHYEYERLNVKYESIVEDYKRCGENWNQTLYLLLFAYVGDKYNKETYKALARRVSYNAILRERSNPLRVEALLLGASGLLKDYPDDHYTLLLKREAEYLMRKYNITPLSSREWTINHNRPTNHPALRLAQVATLFTYNELLFDKVIECRCFQDVLDIFSVEASKYWNTHYIPAKEGKVRVKRLGADKCNVLGINIVVMLQFAYGAYTSNEQLIERAQDLIEKLKPEINYATSMWRKYGIRPKSAFESQALLHLAVNYCELTDCENCFVGKRAMKDFSWLDDAE